ncbi:dihydrolipoamide acetyltransferase family protein [Barrientosiimonas humi]|uniref:dihydrolipoamide acetyltransferase family protein n=1 Tax=Barrientosiimonas humi TaxID=999931 RepID=UPI00370DC4C4
MSAPGRSSSGQAPTPSRSSGEALAEPRIETPDAKVFALPDLGEGLTEAEIVEWLVEEGDEITVDQPVVVVETAKATVDVPCPFAGRLTTRHGAAGEVVQVGAPLVTVGAADAEPALAGARQYREEERAGVDPAQAPREAATEPNGADAQEGSGAVLIGYGTGSGHGAGSASRRARRASTRRASSGPRSSSAGEALAEPVYRDDAGLDTASASAPAYSTSMGDSASVDDPTSVDEPTAVRVISPIVRRLAHEHGVDLAALSQAHGHGVLRRADVEAAAQSSAAAPGSVGAVAAPAPAPTRATGARSGAGEERVPLTGVRRAIAEKLSTSRREIPDATTWVDADATGLLAAKDELRKAYPDSGIGVLALLARICVSALRRFPELNASVDVEAQEIVRHGAINLGFAAQSPRGLVVPVVHDAHELTTRELAAALRDLTAGAREGSLSPAQLTGGTFTLNNYGVFGVDGSTPIINHPEAAMIGVGRIIERPWVVDHELAVRSVTQIGLTFDHRVCDGGSAGGFLRAIADGVERPVALLADL